MKVVSSNRKSILDHQLSRQKDDLKYQKDVVNDDIFASNIHQRFTFVFGSEQESKEFMKQSVKEQFDFYQSISKELSNGFMKPNIMHVGIFGWR